jgi:hypothetical protein
MGKIPIKLHIRNNLLLERHATRYDEPVFSEVKLQIVDLYTFR